MNDNKGQTIFLSVIGIATLLVAIVGATFAWFSATVNNPDEASNSVIVRTANLGTVTFSNGAEINVSDVYPGWTSTKQVSITSDNTSTEPVPYKVYLNIANNEFAAAGAATGYMKYWIVADESNSAGADGILPTIGADSEANSVNIMATSGQVQLLEGSIASAGSTQTFTIHFKFPELGTDQNSQQGKTFAAYLSAATVTLTENATNDGASQYGTY